jgi:translation initiation factor 5A
MTTSKTGKHGHAKVKFVGVDIFTGKKYQELQASTHNMLEVIVTKAEYTCLDVGEDGLLQLLDKENNPGPNISVSPTDFEYKGAAADAPVAFLLKKAFEELPDGQELTVSITTALGESAVQAFKTVAAGK